jgi:hypothetical protein
MPYTKQTWTDNNVSFPVSAARMTVIEQALFDYTNDIAYVEFTSNVSVTATTAATANQVVSAGSVTFDGATTIWVEFYAYAVQAPAVAGAAVALDFWDGGTDLGIAGDYTGAAAVVSGGPVLLRRKVTPPVGAQAFTVRAWLAAGSGTGTVAAGAGGAGVGLPGYIRIVKA